MYNKEQHQTLSKCAWANVYVRGGITALNIVFTKTCFHKRTLKQIEVFIYLNKCECDDIVHLVFVSLS